MNVAGGLREAGRIPTEPLTGDRDGVRRFYPAARSHDRGEHCLGAGWPASSRTERTSDSIGRWRHTCLAPGSETFPLNSFITGLPSSWTSL
jgi:hypothetical protein